MHTTTNPVRMTQLPGYTSINKRSIGLLIPISNIWAVRTRVVNFRKFTHVHLCSILFWITNVLIRVIDLSMQICSVSFICKHDCERSRTCVRRKVRSMVMMMMRTTLVFVDRICFDDMQRSTAIGILLQGIKLATAIRKDEKIMRARIWNKSWN